MPTRSYTISGFTVPSGNNANGATVSSASTLTSTYTLDGWYEEAAATNRIASNTATPVLQANTSYTNSSSQWTNDGAVTLYAGWTGQAKTLPTIVKTGYVCGWTTASTGATTITYASGASITPASNMTLYGVCIASLTVNYEGNGMRFNGNASSNTMEYYENCVPGTAVKTSHTANIDDTGAQIGSNKYDNNLATKDVVTIPGAVSLHATITYATENNYDMLYVFQGEYTGSVTRNMSAGQLDSYMGGNFTTTTVGMDISGDTVTFAFYSDNSGQYWGYYASVIGYDSNNNPIQGQICSRLLAAGEYREPVPDNNHLFQGWSEDNTASTPDYISAEDVFNNLPGNNGETKTLYAIWNPIYHITYVNNCQTYASAHSSCTASVSSGTDTQYVNLDSSGDGSTTLAAHNKWELTGWKIKGWSTVADNSSGANTEYPTSDVYTITGQGAGAGITLYAHWVPAYTIQYDGNGADNPNGMGTTDVNGIKSLKQVNVGEGDEVLLFASNYKKAGYGFVGWSVDPSAWTHFTDNDSSNDPIIYGPNETIVAPAYPNNATNAITLYAVWVPAQKNGNNPVYLQDFGNDECNSLTSTTFDSSSGEISVDKNSIVALTDKRDNQVYVVARLADNKCWMIENLRLNNQYTMGQNQNDNSVTNAELAQGYGGTTFQYGHFVGLPNSEPENNLSDSVASNSVYKSFSEIPVDTYNALNSTLEDIGTADNPRVRFPRYNNDNTANMIDSPTYVQDYGDVNVLSNDNTYLQSYLYSYGNYYSWAAAMATTNYYTTSSTSEPVGTSICPAGWHLPSSNGANKEYGVLSKSYGGSGAGEGTETAQSRLMSERFRSFPNNYVYSGYSIGITTASNPRGRFIDYWSRSAYNTNGFAYAYYFLVNANIVFSPSAWGRLKVDGLTVRCLVDPSMVEVALDSNYGSGVVSRVYGTRGSSVALPPISRESGYKLSSWNTQPDGSGTDYTTSFSIPGNSGDVVLYAQWAQTYSIQYDGNGSDNDSTGMGVIDVNTGVKTVAHINVIEGDTFDLFAPNFKKTGYAFIGWSTDASAWNKFIDNDASNDVRIWGPNETFTAPARGGSSVVTLYAVWAPAKLDNSNNPVYLQNWAGCSSMVAATYNDTTKVVTATKDSITVLTDKRDNQAYAIARLSDGNCWMIDNLKLSVAGTVGNNINDSNVTNQSLAEGYGGVFTGLANPETAEFSSSTTANSLYSTSAITGSNQAYRFPRYNEQNKDWNNNSSSSTNSSLIHVVITANDHKDYDNYVYSYGNYYTWAAAIADTTDYISTTSRDGVETSICPAGWSLPDGYSGNGGFRYLASTMNATANNATSSRRMRSFPNNYIFSGYLRSRTFTSRGGRGTYWSNDNTSNANAYATFATTANFNTVGEYKYYGFTVRCITMDNS